MNEADKKAEKKQPRVEPDFSDLERAIMPSTRLPPPPPIQQGQRSFAPVDQRGMIELLAEVVEVIGDAQRKLGVIERRLHDFYSGREHG